MARIKGLIDQSAAASFMTGAGATRAGTATVAGAGAVVKKVRMAAKTINPAEMI